MSDSPLISVIIPTLNAGKFLRNCLDSLKQQSFEGFEILVVDGGSSDDTAAISATCFMQPDMPHGRWYSEVGLGVYEAMNWGIQHAQGRWCYFLGADDQLADADVFKDIAGKLNAGTADMVYGDVIMKSKGRRYCGPVSLDTLLFHKNIGHQAIFYTRTLLLRMGCYSTRYPVWSDWDLNIRCLKTPGVRHEWVDRTVAMFNDVDGLSRSGDSILSRELPKFATGCSSFKAKKKWPPALWRWLCSKV